MKKILCIVLMMIIIASSAVNVMADEGNDMTVEVSFSSESNSLCISGEIKSFRDRIPVTLAVSQNDNIVALAETTAIGRNGTVVPYSFPSVKLNKMLQNGELIISVSADMVNLNCETSYQYIGIVSQYNVMKSLNSAIVSGNTSLVHELLRANHASFGIDISSLSEFDENVSLLIAATLNEAYTLPETCETEEDINIVRESLGKLEKDFSDGIVVGEFFDADGVSAMKTWYESYKDYYKLCDDVIGTTENEKEMLVYVTQALNDESFLLRRANMTEIGDMNDLFVSLCHQSVLHATEKGNNYIIRNIVDEFPSLITINLSAWNSFDEVKKGQVAASVSGKEYKSFAQLSDAINAAIIKVTSTNVNGGISGGGSSSGGGSGVSVGKNWNVESNLVQETQNKEMKFTDIAHVPWAEASIRYLYKNGVINGKSEETFAPDDVVTRAELVKMLVCALDIKNTESMQHFADVSDDEWYSDYVYAAVENGLITGDGNGLFNPYAPITRQDAATVIYRAVENKTTAENSFFEDYESISPYAREAVDWLYAKGIINGMGDGIFAPDANLSRAQAAKILHLFLTY